MPWEPIATHRMRVESGDPGLSMRSNAFVSPTNNDLVGLGSESGTQTQCPQATRPGAHIEQSGSCERSGIGDIAIQGPGGAVLPSREDIARLPWPIGGPGVAITKCQPNGLGGA